jgi:hypothetical protein
MKSGERHRAKAFELLDRAAIENRPVLKAEFENLATAYLRLAEPVERNTALIVEFKLPRKEKKS